jgi:ATP-dependent Lon protease
VETLGAEASMVFVGNTRHNVPYMLKHTDLFAELPGAYHDSAFLDRIHFYVPGWEVDIIRGEMFSSGYGFVVDYLAEILKSMRNHDYSQKYTEHFILNSDISTRDRDAINKTFSGLMKILFPDGEAEKDEIEKILRFAIEGRKRVKDQLLRIDSTYAPVKFGYHGPGGEQQHLVRTLEEKQYPQHYYPEGKNPISSESATEAEPESAPPREEVSTTVHTPQKSHLVVEENQKGISFDGLFGPYLQGATEIVITDAYIRKFHQARNLMEFLETVARQKTDDVEVEVKLVTIEDEFYGDQQRNFLMAVQENIWNAGISLSITAGKSCSTEGLIFSSRLTARMRSSWRCGSSTIAHAGPSK